MLLVPARSDICGDLLGLVAEQILEVAAALLDPDQTELEGGRTVAARHVKRALADAERRCSLGAERLREAIREGKILIATTGRAVGELNALAVRSTIEHAFGQWILDSHLPPTGSPTQPVEAGYMANAWIRMRHPDYDELRRMLDHVGRTVKVLAG